MNGITQTLVIGSRGSPLALWQSEWVKAQLEKHFRHLSVRVEIIKTTGDRILDSPLSTIGDKGLFTKEIEHALLDGAIDLAVHSLKDVPTALPEGLTIGAITKREDVRDVFVSHPQRSVKRFDDLPHGAAIATGSLRRKCQLMSWRPDLRIIDIRGNLNTRFAKLDASNWDGMILARAGVLRLGWEDRITEVLSLERILPAVGQGALAIEIRTKDTSVLKYLGILSHEPTTMSTCGERALLRRLEGGCQVPIGAYGRFEQNMFRLDGLIGSLDGKSVVRGAIETSPEDSENAGTKLGETLLAAGGERILNAIRSSAAPTPTPLQP